MNQLRINARADLDIDAEALFIAEKFGVELGIQFYDACETTFNQLLTYPQIGKVRKGMVGVLMVRLWAMPGWARKPKPLSACRTTKPSLCQLIDYALAIDEAQGRIALN